MQGWCNNCLSTKSSNDVDMNAQMNTNNERVGNITDYFVSDNADDGEEMT
jgi:hypothetical protein